MELASRLTPGPCLEYRQLQIGAENSSFRNAVGMSSALEALRDVIYKYMTTTTTKQHAVVNFQLQYVVAAHTVFCSLFRC